MAQWVKVLAAKSGNLNLICRTHVVEGEPAACPQTSMCVHAIKLFLRKEGLCIFLNAYWISTESFQNVAT